MLYTKLELNVEPQNVNGAITLGNRYPKQKPIKTGVVHRNAKIVIDGLNNFFNLKHNFKHKIKPRNAIS